MDDKKTAPWDARRNKPRGRWLRVLLTWLFLLGLLGLIGYGLMPKPVEVETAVITTGPLTVHISEEGRTRVRNRYVVAAPVAGQIERVTLRAGDAVECGKTVITRIQPALPPLLDPRAKAQAEARVQVAEAARSQADQSVNMARTAEKFAQSNWTRVQALNDKGSISATDRDNAERDASMKQQEVRAAEFALKVADFELAQARAALLQIATPEAAGSTVEVQAPVSGRVLRVMQESATVITPGTALIEIGDPADLEIEAEILSRDAVAIKPGIPVGVEQWGGTEPLKAAVKVVEPAAFTKVSALGVEEQRVIVRSDFVNPPASAVASLGDRYRVEVRIAVWHSDAVVLIPAGALFREGSDWRTYVLSDGKAVATTVQAGHTDGRVTEVIEGLKPGAKVLLHPPDTVKDGIAVIERAATKPH